MGFALGDMIDRTAMRSALIILNLGIRPTTREHLEWNYVNVLMGFISLVILGLQGRNDQGPVLGTTAPPVVARILKSKNSFDLNANKSKQITVLIFGSCT